MALQGEIRFSHFTVVYYCLSTTHHPHPHSLLPTHPPTLAHPLTYAYTHSLAHALARPLAHADIQCTVVMVVVAAVAVRAAVVAAAAAAAAGARALEMWRRWQWQWRRRRRGRGRVAAAAGAEYAPERERASFLWAPLAGGPTAPTEIDACRRSPSRVDVPAGLCVLLRGRSQPAAADDPAAATRPPRSDI